MPASARQTIDRLRHIAVACTQQHHRELVEHLRPHVPEGGTVIDVGAHAGQFSKLFSDLVGRSGAVHAFEPSGYTRSILKIAVRVTGRRNVVVHPQALSDHCGTLTLHTPIKTSGLRGYGLASLNGVGIQASGEVAESVEVLTLDRFWDQGQMHIDFVKVDIEGWEGHFLRGAEQVLAKDRPALFLEIDQPMLAWAGEDAGRIFQRLSALGYTACKAGDWRAITAYDGPGNYLFHV